MDASPDEVESDNEEELSNKKSDCNIDEVEISHNEKGGSYLLAHQIQEKWEVKFSSTFYSAHQKGWLCFFALSMGVVLSTSNH